MKHYHNLTRIYSLGIVICFLLLLSFTLIAQSGAGNLSPLWWEATRMAPFEVVSQDPVFNFNAYQTLDEQDVIYQLSGEQKLEEVSVFLVFQSPDNEQVMEIQSPDGNIAVGHDHLLQSKRMEYPTESRPRFLTYTGQLGDQLDNNISSAQISYGSEIADQNLHIAECILFDRILNKSERKKIESYLSIKYGISLPLGQDYKDASGRVLLKGKSKSPYRHFITAIGRDDKIGLYQPRSHNLYADFDLTIRLQSNVNQESSTSLLQDGQFLFWSDDQGDLTFSSRHPDYSEGKIMNRTWQLSACNSHTWSHDISLDIVLSDLKDYELGSSLALVLSESASFDREVSEVFYFSLDDEHGKVDVSLPALAPGEERYFTILNGGTSDQYVNVMDAAKTRVYPNPIAINRPISIEIGSEFRSPVTLTVTNTSGQVLWTEDCDILSSRERTIRIDQPGTYFVHMTDGLVEQQTTLIVH